MKTEELPTPRIDEKVNPSYCECEAGFAVNATFARQLEHELVAATQERDDARALLDIVYEAEPLLREEGMENFDGYFCHWNKIINFCASNGLDGYAQSPMEMLVDLVNQRDEAIKDKTLCEAEMVAHCQELGMTSEEFVTTFIVRLVKERDALAKALDFYGRRMHELEVTSEDDTDEMGAYGATAREALNHAKAAFSSPAPAVVLKSDADALAKALAEARTNLSSAGVVYRNGELAADARRAQASIAAYTAKHGELPEA